MSSTPVPNIPVVAGQGGQPKKDARAEDADVTDITCINNMEDLRHQVFQGQLYKFTNVVKGESIWNADKS